MKLLIRLPYYTSPLTVLVTAPFSPAKPCHHLAHQYFRGARNQWHRGFSDRPGYPYLGFRPPPPPHGQAFNAVPPPPFYANQTFLPPPQQHNGPIRPQAQFHNQNRPPPQQHNEQMRPQTPFYNQNRPPPQQYNGQMRPQTPYYNQNRPPPQQYNGEMRPQTPFHNQNRPPPQQHNGQIRPQMPFHNQNFRPRPQRPADFRSWEFPKSGPPPHNHTLQFKVLSYNLLAEYLAINHRAKLYFHIPRYMLDWDWRKKSIIFELGLWSADILCFQEVDRFQDLEEDLKLQGYSGIWKMRSGDPIDGCAIFWRASRFRLLHEECIEYNKLGLRDNVAQICVFELVNQNNDKDLSDSPTRLPFSNRVVICNIHVLYNPRRGEIKLGQVRVLLDRAHAVSKHWDNAPVVLCGDFNCTPKSPLYNYISEQKLDLSDLPRDKVSGQASAEIRPQWQFTPNFRAPQNADRREGAMASSGQIDQPGSLNEHKEINPSVSAIVPSVNSSPQVPSEPKMCDIASKVEDCSNEIVVSSYETRSGKTLNELDSFENEPESTSSFSRTGLEEHLSSRDREKLVVEDLKNGNEPCAVDSSPENSSKGENPLVIKDSENSTSVLISSNDDIPKTSLEVVVSNESDPDIILHEKMENLSLDGLDEHHEGDMGSGVDSSAFLLELHNGNASVSNVVDDEPVNKVFYPYDPSGWTPMETESATGSSDCTVMEHSLKLKSSYTEAEDLSGTRDSHGEPLVTSYNRCFLGTVDYIWRSEGLRTVRVLAPIPKHAMQWTPGFPTKKWGSDHIALVSEFAFTNDSFTQNTESL